MKSNRFKVLVFVVIVALVVLVRYCKETKETYSKVMQKVFKTKVINDLVVNIPESTTCKMIDFVKVQDSVEYLKGEYRDKEERGSVLLDYRMIATVKLKGVDSYIFFTAPFIVSNQGSGVFYYLGLFMQNNNNLTIKHIDTRLLGDRIVLDSITSENDRIQVYMKERSSEQSMSEKPTIVKDISFKLNKKGFVKE